MTGNLFTWYDEHRRVLPWRTNRTPYRVWVAEVVLQQTQVVTVLPYFERWLDRFPDVRSLAASSPDEVLRLWEGLGYYRRGTNLHRAAQIVLEDFGGDLPTTTEALMTLPGIGRYTAAAIASISFGEPLVAVDANVRRVGARLFALPSPTHAEIERHLGARIDPERPGDFNEALNGLGRNDL